MGCWGMGIAQSDEFCENYDNFMEEYDNGNDVARISASILEKYHNDFDDEDGIMHDVYFALAKAEWMCCEQSQLVLGRVKQIIETGANIEFYRELEATENDLKLRQKNLEKFLKMLLTPREKPRKRKKNAPMAEKNFPEFEIGDCFAYKFGDGYRVFCILERFKSKAEKERAAVVIFNGLYFASQLKSTDFMLEKMGFLFSIKPSDFLGQSVIKKVSHLSLSSKCRDRILGVVEYACGNKQSFRREVMDSLPITLQEFLYHCEKNTDESVQLDIGGCYAYKFKNGYRFAVVLECLELEHTPYWLIAIMSDFSVVPCLDFLNANVSSLTLYGKNDIPNPLNWKKLITLDVPNNMQRKLFGRNRYFVSGLFDFLQEGSELQNQDFALNPLKYLIDVCKENTLSAFASLEVGGCYSFKFDDGYKFAVILDRFEISDTEHILVAVLNKSFDSANTDYMNAGLSHIGIYSAFTLPNIEGWKLTDKLPLPDNIKDYRCKYKTVTLESILRFFSESHHQSSTISLSQFLKKYLCL